MKGTGVWISTSEARVGEREREGPNHCFYRIPLIWRDADMEGQGEEGGHAGVTGQMGRQRGVTLWTGTGVSIPVEETNVA